MAKIEQLVGRIGKSVQQKKCLLASVKSPCKILEFLDKFKSGFMLRNFSLARLYLRKYVRNIACIYSNRHI